jgi:hypothetical protein
MNGDELEQIKAAMQGLGSEPRDRKRTAIATLLAVERKFDGDFCGEVVTDNTGNPRLNIYTLIPPICSNLTINSTGLSGLREERSNGHLMLVTGFDDAGNYVFDDPFNGSFNEIYTNRRL